jgi:hypothetical protein
MDAMSCLACGKLDDVPSSEQMEILPNVIIHWPKESIFPAIGTKIKQAKLTRVTRLMPPGWMPHMFFRTLIGVEVSISREAEIPLASRSV